MYLEHVQYLCDPYTKESLQVEIYESYGDLVISGKLYSATNEFPIQKGIPIFNFADKSFDYSKSFGFQWKKWPYLQFEENNRSKPMQNHTTSMFRRITNLESTKLEPDNVILDVGCGSGRFIDLIANSNQLVIGIDSSEAVQSAYNKFMNNRKVLVCQADSMKLPLKNNSIDFAYSIGVLHHTENPKLGVSEIGRVLKSNASAAISVYGKSGYYDNDIVQIYRKVFNRLAPIFGQIPPLIYSYLVVYLTRPIYRMPKMGRILKPLLMYFPAIQLPDVRWSILDTFDSVTPSFQVGISYYELFDYMEESSFTNIRPTNWGGTSLKATKI